MRLIGLADFKSRTGLSATSDDTLLVALLNSVSARAEKYMDRVLTQASYTEVLKPVGRMIRVKAYPVLASPAMVLTDWNLTVASDDYTIDADTGLVMLKWRVFTYQHFESVTVVYTGGYLNAGSGNDACLTVDEDLKDAIAKQAYYEYKHRDSLGIQSLNMGAPGGSVSYFPGEGGAVAKWMSMVREVLDRYKRIDLG